jgi:hypothetical protein
MKVTGQLLGRDAMREGYTHDSTGAPIQDKIYEYHGERWQGLTALWLLGTKKPKEPKPLKRTER